MALKTYDVFVKSIKFSLSFTIHIIKCTFSNTFFALNTIVYLTLMPKDMNKEQQLFSFHKTLPTFMPTDCLLQELLLQLVTADILFIKYTLSNTIYQIPFIKYHLSNTIYQIPFIQYHLSNTIYFQNNISAVKNISPKFWMTSPEIKSKHPSLIPT